MRGWETDRPENLADLIKRDGVRIVITGDSLSYNRYDFEEESRANAFDCLPGIGSWSFRLRDAIYRMDPWFQHGDEVSIRHERNTTRRSSSDLPAFTFPFDNRTLTARIYERDERLTIPYRHDHDANKAVLHLGSVPGVGSCRFDVYLNGRWMSTYENGGKGRNYQGYEPFRIELPASAGIFNEIMVTNWESTGMDTKGDGGCTFHLLGIGSKSAEVYLTGQGGRTADWLLANLDARMTFCSPDLVLLMIGANDQISRTVEKFSQDLRAIIANLHAVNPSARLVLMSPPPSTETSFTISDVDLIQCMREIAEEQDCIFVNLHRLFGSIPPEEWRYDAIHLNRRGNQLLYESVLKLLLNN